MGKAERIENPQGPERVRQRYSFSKKFFKNFLFCVGVQPIYNVVLVSGEQRRDSAVHINVSILPQTSLPSRLPRNIEQSSTSSNTSLDKLQRRVGDLESGPSLNSRFNAIPKSP